MVDGPNDWTYNSGTNTITNGQTPAATLNPAGTHASGAGLRPKQKNGAPVSGPGGDIDNGSGFLQDTSQNPWITYVNVALTLYPATWVAIQISI